MSAVVGDEADLIRESDDELQNLLVVETDVDIFVVYKHKTRSGGSFFPYHNNTIYDLDKYVFS